jgi:glycerol uptake facilitator-like aquaporin
MMRKHLRVLVSCFFNEFLGTALLLIVILAATDKVCDVAAVYPRL